jgi:DNA-binding GntR family transcriptional regulator
VSEYQSSNHSEPLNYHSPRFQKINLQAETNDLTTKQREAIFETSKHHKIVHNFGSMIQNISTSRNEIRPSNTNQWLIDVLREAIIYGEFPEGQPIRQEEFAQRYQVSRMPVREALRALGTEGWVEIIPNKGAYIVPLDPEDVVQLFEARAALEAVAASHSIPKLGAQQKQTLEEAHAQLVTALPHEYLQRHTAFHVALYAAATPRLQRLISQQLDAAERYLRFESKVLTVSNADRKEHQALLEAAIQGDVQRAQALIAEHIADGGQDIARRLRERMTVKTPLNKTTTQ